MGFLRNKKILIIGVACLLIIIIGSLLTYTLLKTSPILPKQISKQLNFVPFVPNKTEAPSGLSNLSYNSKTQVLTYKVNYNGSTITVTEQSTPQQFSDVPQAYSTLVTSLQSQDTFDTPNGTVDITTPKELKGVQVAVMNSKGALFFAKTNKNMSTDTWKQFFINLTLNSQ